MSATAMGRVGDIGIGVCAAHPSPVPCIVTIATGAETSRVNSQASATAISVGISSCGHMSIVLTHSMTSIAEKAGRHRVGDIGALPGGIYTLVTGSPNAKAG